MSDCEWSEIGGPPKKLMQSKRRPYAVHYMPHELGQYFSKVAHGFSSPFWGLPARSPEYALWGRRVL